MSGRPDALERLADRRFDLLVIGAGIVGSRIGYEAASEGLSVALVDAGDYGGCTSSASSKLLHGGLRYLSTGDIRLVRQLQSERRAVATRIAPHLVEALPLVLAVEDSSPGRDAKLAAAVHLYSAVSGFRRPRPRLVGREGAGELIPELRREAVSACGIVTEVSTHDARLTLATARAAARAGAVTVNYARVVDLAREPVRARLTAAVVEDALTGERFQVRFQAVVNAAGPFVDRVRSLEQARCPHLVRLSKGVHVIVPLPGEWRGGLALFDDASTAIAIPWQGMLLIGATDTPCESTLVPPIADPGEVRQLLDRFSDVLPRDQLLPERVVHAFAGVRALPLGNGPTWRASRRHVVAIGSGGMVSIAGGKLTTHRLIAMDALRNLPAELRPRRRRPLAEPLGGTGLRTTERLLGAGLDGDVAVHLERLYGDDALRVAAYCARVSDALERIDPAGPDIWAQVDFARDEESALTVADVVERRTTLAVRGLASRHVAGAVRRRLAGPGLETYATTGSPRSSAV